MRSKTQLLFYNALFVIMFFSTNEVLAQCTITGNNFCYGYSSQLCATASSSYLWNTGATTQCITITVGGTFSVITTDASGGTSSCDKTVIAYSPPSCTITGNSSTPQGSPTLWCAPAGLLGYSWSTGATTECIAVSLAGNYSVTVTDANGCTATCYKDLEVIPTCSITGNNFCYGYSSQLCATASSSYLWNTGATTQCITTTVGGTYSVTVTNAGGTTNTCDKTVIAYSPPSCTITGNSSTPQGSPTLWCAPAGLLGYSWSTGATTQCIAVSLAGNYSVTVTDANGCTATCYKDLEVIPTCAITGNNFCYGYSSQLCATASSSYLWNTGATTQCITTTVGGTYSVTVTNAGGTTNTCDKTVIAYSPPNCTITGNSSTPQGSPTLWCAPAGLLGYSWSTGATTECIVVSLAGNYSVTVTDANGCTAYCNRDLEVLPNCAITGNNFCYGYSSQLCAAPNSSYLWNTGATTQCITTTVGGTYSVTVSNSNGSTSSCDKTVIAYSPPGCTISGNSSVTQGNSTLWCAPAGLLGYSWSTGATTQCIAVFLAGNYSVTVTDANGCTAYCDKDLEVLPNCLINGSNSVCAGSQTQWCAPAGNAAYLWSNGVTTQCITVAAAATYSVTVTNSSGSTNTCSKTLAVDPLPSCLITGSGAICSGGSTQWCAPNGLGAYLWSTGATTQCVTLNATGNYSVTTTDAKGCSNSCNKDLTVGAPLSIDAGSNKIVYRGYPDSSCATLQSCCISGGTPPYSLTWSNGGLHTSSITVCPTTSTTYYLTVTDAIGCSARDSVRVCVFDIRCGPGKKNVTICHGTGSTNNPFVTICIDVAGAKWHMQNHPGEKLGACGLVKVCNFPGLRLADEFEELTDEMDYLKAYPNPFTDKCSIEFMFTQDVNDVTLDVFDLNGSKVASLYNGAALSGTPYTVELDAALLPNGIYIYRLTSPESTSYGKLILVR